MKKLIAMLMLVVSTPAMALEVGEIFQLKFEPNIQLQTRACDTLEKLRH